MSVAETPNSHQIDPSVTQQPMGLEEGDQALVDAVNRIAEGEHRVSLDPPRLRGVATPPNVRTHVKKDENDERILVTTETVIPDSNRALGRRDGSTQSTLVIIDKDEEGNPDGVRASFNERFTNRSKMSISASAGDTSASLHTGDFARDLTFDRSDPENGQQIKLRIAQEIGAATQRLIEKQVQDPDLAWEMAEAEAPYRERKIKREKDGRHAREAAAIAHSEHPGSDPRSEQLRKERAQKIIERADQWDLGNAASAAEIVRRQHETKQ